MFRNHSLVRFILFLFLFVLLPGIGGSAPADEKKVVFVGDISFGENYRTIKGVDTIKGNRRYSFPLEKFSPILMNAVMAIGNLETPVTDNLLNPVKGKKYLHWTHPVKTPEALARNNIQAVSLANNHTLDYGTEGLMDTMKYLDFHGISWIGGGMGLDQAKLPFHFRIDLESSTFDCFVIAAFEYRKSYDRYDFYAGDEKPGVMAMSTGQTSAQIREIRSVYPEAFIVLFPHWGRNYSWRSEGQMRLAHQLIDEGVDLILGHGAHMMQEIEKYKGKWIIYSLGNFVFNSQGRYAEFRVDPVSLIAQLEFSDQEEKGNIGLKLYPIITDNRITRYQGYFVDNATYRNVVKTLITRDRSGKLEKDLTMGHDLFGNYLELVVK